MIRFASFIFLSYFSIHCTYSQIGLNVHLSSFDENLFSAHLGNANPQQNTAPVLGIDYWFRLKQKRIEFQPTIQYADYGGIYEVRQVGLLLHASIYPFDLDGDCNCPTFSKENELIKKGFYVRLTPGFGHWAASAQKVRGFETADDLSVILPEIGLGIGLDIGISNLFTLTPQLRYRYIIGGNWDGEVDFSFDAFDILEPGLRLGLRFDEKNYGFKTRRRR